MKKGLLTFLQVVVVLIGLAVLVFMLWEPHLEGVNAHATNFEIYFKDPFLAYAYVGSIPFFVGLYQVFKALGLVRQGQAYSLQTVKALRTLTRCALATFLFVVGALIFILAGESDDRAGGVFMCGLVILGSSLVAIVATLFKRVILRTKTTQLP